MYSLLYILIFRRSNQRHGESDMSLVNSEDILESNIEVQSSPNSDSTNSFKV